MSARVVWTIWATTACLWLVGSIVFIAAHGGFGLNPLGIGEPERLSPLLSREECAGLADPYATNACRGIASLSRQRRVMSDLSEAEEQAVVGTFVIGPPFFGLLLAWVIVERLKRNLRKRQKRWRPPGRSPSSRYRSS